MDKYINSFITFSLALDICASYFFLLIYPDYDIFSITFIIITHLLAAFIAAWPFAVLTKKTGRLALFVFIIIFTIPLGGYVAVVQLVYAGESRVQERMVLYEEYRQHILSSREKIKILPQLKDSYNYFRRSIEFESIYDTIKFESDSRKKLDIIKTLGKIKTKDSLKALKLLLSDPHMEVRYYAGEEISTINEQYNIFINELKKNIIKDQGNVPLYVEMGKLLVNYAFTGFFEQDEIKDKLEEAKVYLEKSLELDPVECEAMSLLACIHTFRREYDKAIDLYKQILVIKSTLGLKGEDIPVMTGLIECLWEKKDIKQLNIYIKKFDKLLADSTMENIELIREFINVWSGSDDNLYAAGKFR